MVAEDEGCIAQGLMPSHKKRRKTRMSLLDVFKELGWRALPDPRHVEMNRSIPAYAVNLSCVQSGGVYLIRSTVAVLFDAHSCVSGGVAMGTVSGTFVERVCLLPAR